MVDHCVQDAICPELGVRAEGPEELLQKFGFQVDEYDQNVLAVHQHSAGLVAALCRQSSCSHSPLSFPRTNVDEEDCELRGMDNERPASMKDRQQAEPQKSQHQKDLVRKLRITTGHPRQDRFRRTLRAAGALPDALKNVRAESRWATCAVKRGPDPRRKAHCPRVFSFNKVLSMDVFFIQHDGVFEPTLNVVCHGTNC